MLLCVWHMRRWRQLSNRGRQYFLAIIAAREQRDESVCMVLDRIGCCLRAAMPGTRQPGVLD